MEEENLQDIWDQEAAGEEPPEERLDGPNGEQPADEPEQATEDLQQGQDDPFAGVPDVIKAELEKLRNQNSQLMHEVKSATGRVAAMQREFDIAKRAKDETQASGDDAPSQGEIKAALKSPDKWNSLKDDFPDWAEAMEELVAANMGGGQAQIPEGYLRQEDAQAALEQTRTEMKRQLEEAKLDMRFENWREDVQSDDFVKWVGVQKPEVQALANSESAKDAMRMLSMFNEAKNRSTSAVKQERGARLSVAATQRGPSAPPPKTVDNMSASELWDYEAKLRAKRATGY